MRNRITCLVFSITILAAVSAFSEGTRQWEQSKYDDFSDGTTHGVAISSKGYLQLAPAFKLIATTPSSAIWAAAAGPSGDVYLATGTPAKVYRIPAGGQPTAIFLPQELQVQTLVVDKRGVIYAATNPDGKVYKLERKAGKAAAKDEKPEDWTSSVYFDPGTKYIWSLALDDSGNLYVATGDNGQIFRVTPSGEHSLFFKSDEPHIRTLAFDMKGNLIAGSDGSGLIYRITPKGEGFVLYSAPKREITSLAIDAAGSIYAAAAGEKRSGESPKRSTATIVVPSASPSAGSTANPVVSIGNAGATQPEPPPITLSSSSTGVPGGSEIYRISPDGSPSRLWSSRDDLVYTLAFDSRGRLLAGTGNRWAGLPDRRSR